LLKALLSDRLLREPLHVGVDRELERPAVDGLLLDDGRAGEADAVGAALVGGRAVGRREARVGRELEPVCGPSVPRKPTRLPATCPFGYARAGCRSKYTHGMRRSRTA